MVQVEMKHQNIGMDGNAPEHAVWNGAADFCCLIFGVKGGAFCRLAQIRTENVARNIESQRPVCEDELVVDKTRGRAAGGEDHDILARPV